MLFFCASVRRGCWRNREEGAHKSIIFRRPTSAFPRGRPARSYERGHCAQTKPRGACSPKALFCAQKIARQRDHEYFAKRNMSPSRFVIPARDSYLRSTSADAHFFRKL